MCTAISINIYHTKLCNSGPFTYGFAPQFLVTGCNPNDLDICTDWCRLGLQFVMYKSAEQEWSFID